MRGSFQVVDTRPFRKPVWRDIAPVLTGVLRDMYQAIVGPGPNHVLVQARGSDREDGGIIFFQPTAVLPRLVVSGEIGTDGFPTLTLVDTTEKTIAAGQNRLGIEGRNDDRVGPLKAVLNIRGDATAGVIGPDGDIPKLVGRMIVTRKRAEIATAISDFRIRDRAQYNRFRHPLRDTSR